MSCGGRPIFRCILIFNKLRKRDRSSLFGKCGKLSVPLLIKLQLYRICWGERACSQSQSKGGVGGFSDVISCLIQGKDQV